MNFCVTDGNTVVATRLRRPETEEAPSLYYASGAWLDYGSEDDIFSVTTDGDARLAIITSEPLTYVTDDWHVVPNGSMLSVTSDGRGNMTAIDIESIH
jgi:predicted glutamine amidotransferase